MHPFKGKVIEKIEDSNVMYYWWRSYKYEISYIDTSVVSGFKDLELARAFAQGEILRRQDAVVAKLKGT